MQLTKQQKIVGALLAVAVAALVTDRLVIGHEPAEETVASAEAPAAARPQAAPARRAAVRQAPQGVAAASPAAEANPGGVAAFAARLENVRMTYAAGGAPMDLEAVRDAFRPPAALVGSRKAETTNELADAAKRFADKHKLAAVIKRQSGKAVAIIEDKSGGTGSLSVAVGQSLDGFTLVAVKDRVAILRRGSQRVELRLQEDANAATITPSEKVAGVEVAK